MRLWDVNRCLAEGQTAFQGRETWDVANRLVRVIPPEWTTEDLQPLVQLFLGPDDGRTVEARVEEAYREVGGARWQQWRPVLEAAGYEPEQLALPDHVRARREPPPLPYDGEYATDALLDGMITVGQLYHVGVREPAPDLLGVNPRELPMPPCVWAPIVNPMVPRTQRILLPAPDSAGRVEEIICQSNDSLNWTNKFVALDQPGPDDAILVRNIRDVPVLLCAAYVPGALRRPMLLFGAIAGQSPEFVRTLGAVLARCRAAGWACWAVLAADSDHFSRDDIGMLLAAWEGLGAINLRQCTVYETAGPNLALGIRGDGGWGEVPNAAAFGLGALGPLPVLPMNPGWYDDDSSEDDESTDDSSEDDDSTDDSQDDDSTE